MIRGFLANAFLKVRNPDLVERINHFLLYETDRLHTQCGLVLGGRGVSGEVAREAARLYHAGCFDKLVVSGGVIVYQPVLGDIVAGNKHLHSNHAEDFIYPGLEVDQMYGTLLKEGVPKEAIIYTEGASTHTGENIRNCKRVLDEMESITIVCRADNQRRAHATARRWLRDRPIITTAAVYPFGLNHDNWHDTPISRTVLEEYKKLDIHRPGNYVQRGFCAPLDMVVEAVDTHVLCAPEPRVAQVG